MDLSSLHITAPSGEPLTSIALSTKYTSLGQCAPAIAGLGWVQSTDYDTQDCTKPAPPPAPAQGGPPGKGGKGHRGGAGGDASNRIAVQFDICCERKSPWSLIVHARSPARCFLLLLIPPSPLAAQTWTRTSKTLSTTRPRPSMRRPSVTTSRCVDRAPCLLPVAERMLVAERLRVCKNQAYAKVICNADGSITQKQYFDQNCRGAEADMGSKIRELLEAEISADTGLPQGVLDLAGDLFVQLPVPDTMENGQCVVEAEINLSQVTGNPADDSYKSTKWEFEGCVAATAKVAGVSSQDYTSLNCRDGTESQHESDSIHEQMQFDVCTENPALDNLIDDPSTPFDETSVGRYMPGYLKMHCNDDDTVTVRHYHDQACSPR